jgi:Co/Zn/Cd efflux system component
MPPRQLDARRLRRIVLVVALLNLSYFFVEFTVALVAGSVSLLADSVDFLEDTAINLLIFIALGWPLAKRAAMGKAMALVILGPAAVAAWEAIQRFSDPVAPAVVPVVLASLGAIAINGASAWLLVRVRHHGGSLSRAAFLSARNDVLVNVAIIGMAGITLWTTSGWPTWSLAVSSSHWRFTPPMKSGRSAKRRGWPPRHSLAMPSTDPFPVSAPAG